MSISELMGMMNVTGAEYPKVASIRELNQWLRERGKEPYPAESIPIENPDDEHHKTMAVEEHLKRQCGLAGERC